MVLPLFLILVQGIGQPSKATKADSVYVRTMLDSATVNVAAETGRRLSDVEYMLVDQIVIWRGADAAWEFARKLDQRKLPNEHFYAARFLATLMHGGKREKSRELLLGLSAPEREPIVARLPNFMGTIPPDIAPLLDSLTTSAIVRADRLFRQAVGLRQNPIRNLAAARDTMRRAIEVLRSTGREHYPLEWAIELIRMGERIPVSKLIEMGITEDPNTREASARVAKIMGIHYVANRLFNLDARLASSIADTLLRELPNDTTTFARIITADLLQKRAAPGDSAAAAKIRDLLRARSPKPPAHRVNFDYELHEQFRVAIRKRDTELLDSVLVRWRESGRPAGALAAAASAIPTSSWYRDAALPQDEREWSNTAIKRLWIASAVMPPTARDSARFELIKLLAQLDPFAALDSARRVISSQPTRDRARAEAIRRLANIDVHLAEREALTLNDKTARDATYRVLTSTAIAGGRLQDARRFADLISRGSTAWISSQYALAQTAARMGAGAEVVQRIRAVLMHLSAVPECSGCVMEVGAPERAPGHFRREIIDILSVALQHDLHSEINRWALGQTSASARIWAWLEISQAMSFVKLGLYPSVPIHGR